MEYVFRWIQDEGTTFVYQCGEEYYGFTENQVRETFQQLPENLRAMAEAQESLDMIPSIDSEPAIEMPASATDKPASASDKPAIIKLVSPSNKPVEVWAAHGKRKDYKVNENATRKLSEFSESHH